MSEKIQKTKSRLETLDQLRGFFIIVIIVDHLSRWPSLLGIFTGKALLWVTAAEGFVSISGLLVGYIRGYKNRDLPFKEVSVKLLKRAGLLYTWSLIASVFYITILWYVPLIGGSPSPPIATGNWGELLFKLITLQYTFVWVHFLTLYALFLAASPFAIWLFRQNKAWLVGVISLALLALGWITQSEPLQWQFLFFIPSIVGFYLEPIMNWWKKLTKKTAVIIMTTAISLTLATIVISIIFTFYAQNFQAFASSINALFAKDSISLLRAGMAFLWFTGFIFIFYLGRAFITKALNWLLIPIGTHSLTAYILHGLALCTISFFTVAGSNMFNNTLLGLAAILIVWTLLKIPFVRKVVPA